MQLRIVEGDGSGSTKVHAFVGKQQHNRGREINKRVEPPKRICLRRILELLKHLPKSPFPRSPILLQSLDVVKHVIFCEEAPSWPQYWKRGRKRFNRSNVRLGHDVVCLLSRL